MQRARKLRTIYSEAFELTSKCRQFDDPSTGFVAKTMERIKSHGEGAFLKDFWEFTIECKKLFNSVKKMFSTDEINIIFYRHGQPRNTLENLIHRLYFTNESYFSCLERLEAVKTITPKWREILQQYNQ